MVDQIRIKVEEIFKNAPRNKKIQDLKEEMIGNLEEKYQDLISCGKTPQEAYDISIASIGDIDELITSMSEGEGKLYKMPILEKKSLQEEKVSLDKKEVNNESMKPQAATLPSQVNQLQSQHKKVEEKKVDVVSVTILSCLGVFVLFVMFRVITGMHHIRTLDHFNMSVEFSNLEVAKEESTEIAGINKIETKLYDADVEVSFWDKNNVKVIESTNDSEKKDLFSISQSGSTLEITRPVTRNVGSFGPSAFHKVQIFIPESFDEELDLSTTSGNVSFLTAVTLSELNVTTSSGDTSSESSCTAWTFSQQSTSGCAEYSKIISKDYTIQASSGDIKIDQLQGKGSINTTAGYVSLGDVTGEKHEITTSSGDVEIEAGNGDFTIESTSGNVEIKELSGAFEQKSSSGDVTIGLNELKGDSKAETTSGQVEISRQGNVNATITCQTNSGDIEGDCDITYSNKNKDDGKAVWGNGAENTITIATSSGDIDLTD